MTASLKYRSCSFFQVHCRLHAFNPEGNDQAFFTLCGGTQRDVFTPTSTVECDAQTDRHGRPRLRMEKYVSRKSADSTTPVATQPGPAISDLVPSPAALPTVDVQKILRQRMRAAPELNWRSSTVDLKNLGVFLSTTQMEVSMWLEDKADSHALRV